MNYVVSEYHDGDAFEIPLDTFDDYHSALSFVSELAREEENPLLTYTVYRLESDDPKALWNFAHEGYTKIFSWTPAAKRATVYPNAELSATAEITANARE